MCCVCRKEVPLSEVRRKMNEVWKRIFTMGFSWSLASLEMRLFLVALLESWPAPESVRSWYQGDKQEAAARQTSSRWANGCSVKECRLYQTGMLECRDVYRWSSRLALGRMNTFSLALGRLHEVVNLNALWLAHQRQVSSGVVRQGESCKLSFRCVSRTLASGYLSQTAYCTRLDDLLPT